MKPLVILASTALLFVACAITVPAIDDTHGRDNRKPGSTQVGFSTIVVNGRTLTGPNSSAQTRDSQLLIPVATLARALGDTVQIDPAGRSLSVVRQTGITTAYDSRLGQVTENGAVALTVSNHGSIVFSPHIEEIMLPVEIVSALFDAAIRYDRQKNAVLVTRGVVGLVTQQKEKRGFGEIYQAEYEYDLNRYSSTNSQNLTLNAVGRLADGRFSFVSNSSGSLGKLSPRNLSFNLDRPNGQHFTAGDFGTGSGLQLLTSNIRGALASIPVGNFTIATFGGRSNSGTTSRGGFVGDDFSIPQTRSSRDTNVFGVVATTKPFDSGVLKPLIFSAGAMRFSGSARHGNVVSTSVNFGGRRAQLQADFGLGTFSGRSSDNRMVNGSGMAVDVAGSYQVASNLSFQGRFAHIGSNFLAPQSGIREPIDLRAGGVSWSPVKWLTASMTASTTRRPNDTGRAESFVSTSFAISPGGTAPQFYISHIQSSSKAYRSGEFTIINFSKSFHRIRLFGYRRGVKNIGPASVNTQIGANFLLNDRNTIEFSYTPHNPRSNLRHSYCPR